MSQLWLAVFLLAFCAGTSHAMQAADEMAQVSVLLVSLDGLRLPPGRLSVVNDRGQTVASPAIADKVEVQLPFGVYEFRVRGDGFEETRRTVAIRSRKAAVLMGVPFRTFHAPPTTSSVSIAVQPARSCIAGGRLVARIFAVFGDSSFEREVTSFGYALFEPLEPGVYAVMVLDGPRIRATQTIHTTQSLHNLGMKLNLCQGAE